MPACTPATCLMIGHTVTFNTKLRSSETARRAALLRQAGLLAPRSAGGWRARGAVKAPRAAGGVFTAPRAHQLYAGRKAGVPSRLDQETSRSSRLRDLELRFVRHSASSALSAVKQDPQAARRRPPTASPPADQDPLFAVARRAQNVAALVDRPGEARAQIDELLGISQEERVLDHGGRYVPPRLPTRGR